MAKEITRECRQQTPSHWQLSYVPQAVPIGSMKAGLDPEKVNTKFVW